ncbi:hypothetical protein JXQ70_17645 [bacterium]|nr:hypothetical protein [bacterium]
MFRGRSLFWKAIIGLCILGGHIFVTLHVTKPGYLLIDEGVHHLMSRSFAQTKDFTIINGYHEFPSVEFGLPHFFPAKGRLVSQYPGFYTVLAHPFFIWFGFKGLYLLNALSFLIVMFFSYMLAQKLFKNHDLSFGACLLLCLGTFCWEYSQAAWPHQCALLFIMVGFYLALCGLSTPEKRTSNLYLVLSGLTISLGAGIRVDVFLVFPCICLLLVLFGQGPARQIVVLLAGACPGLMLLSLTNLNKYGVFSPFYYGSGDTFPLIPFVYAVVAIGLLWLAKILYSSISPGQRKILGFVMVAGLALLGFLALGTDQGLQIVNNAYSSVVDIRAVPLHFDGAAHIRTQGRGLVYTGAQKKALLQSIPWLVILTIPFWLTITGSDHRREFLILLPVPLAFISYYAFVTHQYGGLCLNYRYHLPVLPFASIMAAYAIRLVVTELCLLFTRTKLVMVSACVLVLTISTHLFMTYLQHRTLEELEFPLLTVPLVLALVLFFFVVTGYCHQRPRKKVTLCAIWLMLVISAGWSAGTNFSYDYRIHHLQRVANYQTGERILELIPPDSIFSRPCISMVSCVSSSRARLVSVFP